MTLIAEDVLLLLLDDTKGTVSAWGNTDAVLGGAVLAELAAPGTRHGRREEEHLAGREGARHRCGARRPRPRARRGARHHRREGPQAPAPWSTKIGKGLEDRLAAGLAERRILERRDGKRLGLVPRTTWPAADTSRDNQLRRTITVCLADGGRPDERTAALIALLWAVDEAHKAVATNTATTKRQLKKRAKEIAEGQWAAKAVKDAVAAATASRRGCAQLKSSLLSRVRFSSEK